MKKRKIAYFVNPISGTSKKEALLKQIEKATQKKELGYEIVPTNAAGNYHFFEERIHADGFTDVVIIGGDGTVNQVVDALKHMPVQFGIIPTGSGNGLSNAAGIPRNVKSALELIFEGSSKPTDAFTINGQFSCMLSGLGFDAQVAHDFATKASRGLLTYTQQSILHFFKAQPYQFEIRMDNFSFFTDAFFISIANSNQFGNNFTIAPEAKLDDGLLDVVVVQKMSKAALPFAILKQIKGNNKLQQLVNDAQQKNVLYFQTAALSIGNAKHAPLHIDGEPKETATHFDIAILPKCFHLIRQ